MHRRRTQTFTSQQKTGLILILVGSLFFIAIFSFRVYREERRKILSFSQVPHLEEEAPESLYPVEISISEVRINLPVFEARAEGDSWEISQAGASYLVGSGVPGKKGNVVIYGHNKNSLFGPIRWLNKNQTIKVKNGKGEEFVYQIVETMTVSPNDVWVLAPTAEPMLTLYTCTGFMDKKRFVVVARLSS